MKLGIIFGGRSSEHEISCLSAASVIRTLAKSKYELVYIGITRSGDWKRFEGDVSEIENGKWEESAISFDMGKINDYIDFAFPILHSIYRMQGAMYSARHLLWTKQLPRKCLRTADFQFANMYL